VSWLKLFLTLSVSITNAAGPSDFIVYSVYNNLDMGNPGEVSQRDYYINMGTKHGLKAGATVDVYKQMASYDLMTKKLFKDVTFPFAKLKIIHIEENAAVARLEKLLPAETTPATTPRGVMVGDIVKPAN
jgi:hypothetical protein